MIASTSWRTLPKLPVIKRWLARHPCFELHFTPTGSSWMKLIERFFRDLSQQAILPVLKGEAATAEGYDVFDDYDLGSKNQNGTAPTRYGTREQLVRCVAIMRANGLDVYVELLENERDGGSCPGGFTFRYMDGYGNPGGGRFPKNPENFHPFVPEDPNVPGPDIWFGPDLAPITRVCVRRQEKRRRG
jgi:hypothetical protein